MKKTSEMITEALETQEEAKKDFFFGILLEALIAYDQQPEKAFTFTKYGFTFRFEDEPSQFYQVLTFVVYVSFNGKTSNGHVVKWGPSRMVKSVAAEIYDSIYEQIK